MINQIENLVTSILDDFLSQGYKAEICLNRKSNNNNSENEVSDTCDNERRALPLEKLCYRYLCNRQRFATFLYVLAEVHDLFLSRSHCTYRQLYYRNVDIGCNTLQIKCAVNNVCQALGTKPWNLGIFAAGKCFVSGKTYHQFFVMMYFDKN